MTKEEKAKAYDEALARCKWQLANKLITEESATDLFRELAESEDDRIRKEAISIVQSYMNICDEEGDPCLSGYKVLAWLEKRKEQKPTDVKDPFSNANFVRGYESGYADAKREQNPVEKPINWTELTWKDIVELEGIINNVHYEFRNGIGQESFGKEVLEKFREYKGDEYLEEWEQKPVELSKEDYVKKFKALCDAYEIKLPNREYDIYHLCDDLSKLFIDSGKKPEEWNFPCDVNETVIKLIAIAECLEMDGNCLFNGYSGTECGKFLRELARKQVECKPAEGSKEQKRADIIREFTDIEPYKLVKDMTVLELYELIKLAVNRQKQDY